MGNLLLKADRQEAKGEIDQIAIDYRLKLIAFQDELFQSRKKLQDSDRKMTELQKKLEEYVRNKENQIAEVMFTAHMNAQRIEAQTRSQTEYIILEMEEEMQRKQKELELLQKKTNRFVDDNLTNMDDEDIGSRMQIVQDNIRAFREQMETTEISDDQSNIKPASTAKITELKSDPEQAAKREEKRPENTDAISAVTQSAQPAAILAPASPEKDKSIQTPQSTERTPEQAVQVNKEDKSSDKQVQAGEAEPGSQPVGPKKRRVVAKKPGKKTKLAKEQVGAPAADVPPEFKEQVAELSALEAVKGQGREPAADAAANYFEDGWNGLQAASQVEPNERMRLDAFVDARYYQIINGQKEMQHHALQVTIEVEVPPDNYSVRYTKVSSDVVSTLLQYDNVVLNDIFPFNIIEPNPQNIAMYFFNCLEDMLSLMDLVLHSLVVLELPDLQIQINSRNTKLDNFLHQGVDAFDSIRDSLIPCVEREPDPISPFKGTISRILKKRN
ncbi:MAG: hypothetical protein VB084_06935 [Syntrophomonadaceae bacterium]|nr:hypothetical protein [Syntrophomonadaceae bacterium]